MKAKYRQKRTKPIEKIWYILQPFFIYMIAKTIAMVCLSYLSSALLSEEMQATYASLVNALASICGVAFVMKDFLIEVAVTGEIDIDGNGVKHFFSWIKNGVTNYKGKWLGLVLTACLAITSSLAFNILISLMQIRSGKYDNVQQIQYAVPFWIGLLLYGVISPWVEEIVFRGLIFNRMKHYYSVLPTIVITSIMFGAFHANIPQIIYGTCMGILMASCYYLIGCFGAPLLFHTVANIFVYVTTILGNGSFSLASPGYCVLFFLLSFVSLFAIWYAYFLK